MSRKKQEFGWVRGEDDEDGSSLAGAEEGGDEDYRPIRSDHRGAMMDLKALANRLAKLPSGLRRTLPLDEETQRQLDMLAAADQRPDRRRVLMRAKLLLGAVDPVQLEAAIAGDTPVAILDRALIDWRTRIVAGDDAVLQSFVEAYPATDRQAVRTSARETRGQGPGAAAASRRLLQLLRNAATGQSEE